MERYLYSGFHRHDSFTIREVDDDIVFTETSCFDYDLLEYDVRNAVISKMDFIEGIREFLKTGSCMKGGMIIENREEGDIYIYAASSAGYVSWIVRGTNGIFQEKLKQILEKLTTQ